MAGPSLSPVELRDAVLDGYTPLKTFAAAHHRTETTARRWVKKLNLPCIKVGSETWLHVAGARAILTGQKPVPAPPQPRPRGRPRKIATAANT
jgi:hypothetical protein